MRRLNYITAAFATILVASVQANAETSRWYTEKGFEMLLNEAGKTRNFPSRIWSRSQKGSVSYKAKFRSFPQRGRFRYSVVFAADDQEFEENHAKLSSKRFKLLFRDRLIVRGKAHNQATWVRLQKVRSNGVTATYAPKSFRSRRNNRYDSLNLCNKSGLKVQIFTVIHDHGSDEWRHNNLPLRNDSCQTVSGSRNAFVYFHIVSLSSPHVWEGDLNRCTAKLRSSEHIAPNKACSRSRKLRGFFKIDTRDLTKDRPTRVVYTINPPTSDQLIMTDCTAPSCGEELSSAQAVDELSNLGAVRIESTSSTTPYWLKPAEYTHIEGKRINHKYFYPDGRFLQIQQNGGHPLMMGSITATGHRKISVYGSSIPFAYPERYWYKFTINGQTVIGSGCNLDDNGNLPCRYLFRPVDKSQFPLKDVDLNGITPIDLDGFFSIAKGSHYKVTFRVGTQHPLASGAKIKITGKNLSVWTNCKAKRR